MNMVKSMDIPMLRRKESSSKATKAQHDDYRSFAGSSVWVGSGSLPHASFVGSYMQQVSPRLRVQNLTEANRILNEIRYLEPTISFSKVKADAKSA